LAVWFQWDPHYPIDPEFPQGKNRRAFFEFWYRVDSPRLAFITRFRPLISLLRHEGFTAEDRSVREIPHSASNQLSHTHPPSLVHHFTPFLERNSVSDLLLTNG
jgi:hypothetical protein